MISAVVVLDVADKETRCKDAGPVSLHLVSFYARDVIHSFYAVSGKTFGEIFHQKSPWLFPQRQSDNGQVI